MKTELFVCDRCGRKERLDRSKQHWCTYCAGKRETEMRPAREKPFSIPPVPEARR